MVSPFVVPGETSTVVDLTGRMISDRVQTSLGLQQFPGHVSRKKMFIHSVVVWPWRYSGRLCTAMPCHACLQNIMGSKGISAPSLRKVRLLWFQIVRQAKFRAHHEKRLEEISRRAPGTGTVDNTPPYTARLVHLKTRPKKKAILAARDAEVERANRCA